MEELVTGSASWSSKEKFRSSRVLKGVRTETQTVVSWALVDWIAVRCQTVSPLDFNEVRQCLLKARPRRNGYTERKVAVKARYHRNVSVSASWMKACASDGMVARDGGTESIGDSIGF